MKLRFPEVGFSGKYRLVVSKDKDMKEVVSDVEFDNLITNTGLNRIGNSPSQSTSSITNFRSTCGRFVVGSGSTPPEVTDTSLENPVAFASSDPTLDNESSNYSRGYMELVVTHQFGQGEAEGNLSEIGIQHGSLSGPLFSRALILDGLGNPTTITVRDTDFLTCYYTLRVNIPQTDSVMNVDVDYGDGGIIPTTVTIRPIGADSVFGLQSAPAGWTLKFRPPSSAAWSRIFASASGLQPATATQLLNENSISISNIEPSVEAYVTDSFKRKVTREFGLTDLNSGTISTLRVSHWGIGAWQLNFDPPLEKNNTQTLTLGFEYGWGRA